MCVTTFLGNLEVQFFVMSKKSKKRTEEKVPLKEKPAAVTASRKETKDRKKKLEQNVSFLYFTEV